MIKKNRTAVPNDTAALFLGQKQDNYIFSTLALYSAYLLYSATYWEPACT